MTEPYWRDPKSRCDWSGATFIVAAWFLLFGSLFSQARADPVLPYGYTCEQVRSFVNVNGRVKALAMAVEQGATWAQIAAARRCLNRKPAEQ